MLGSALQAISGGTSGDICRDAEGKEGASTDQRSFFSHKSWALTRGRLHPHFQALPAGHKTKMPTLPPRIVKIAGGPTSLWVLEVRALHINRGLYKGIFRALDAYVRREMAVVDFKLLMHESEARHEVVIVAVVNRKTAVARADNVYLAWMRIVTRLLRFDGSQRRRAWQPWPKDEESYPKLHADARPIQLYLDARPASQPFVETCLRVAAAAKENGAMLASSSRDLPALPE